MNDNIVIKIQKIEKEITEQGYTTHQLLSKEQIDELKKLCTNYFNPKIKDAKYNYDSNADADCNTKKLISDEIQRIVKPSIDRVFSNYEFIPSIFFIKHPSPDSAVPMHNDPTLLIDEAEKTHIKIWCPLHDVDDTNGAMSFIKGSHRFVPPVSAVTIPSHFAGVYDELPQYATDVPLKTGEAVIFDNRTLHQSTPNISENIRLTAIISIVAPNRQFISLFKDTQNSNSPIEVYFQEKDWFYHPEWHNQNKRPKTGIFKGYLDYSVFQINRQQLIELISKPSALKDFKYHIKPPDFNIIGKIKSLFR